MTIQSTMYSGKSAMTEKAAADPNSGLHIEVRMLLPPASNTLAMPYAVRMQRKGAAINAHLRYCDVVA